MLNPTLPPQNTSSSAALIAGATAGAVEGFITYPFEALKTYSQLSKRSGTSTQVSQYLLSASDMVLKVVMIGIK